MNNYLKLKYPYLNYKNFDNKKLLDEIKNFKPKIYNKIPNIKS